MKKQTKPDTILVWTREQSSDQEAAKEETLNGKTSLKRSPRKKEKQKETPEEMVRALQGIFCQGRYRSWLLNRPKHKK